MRFSRVGFRPGALLSLQAIPTRSLRPFAGFGLAEDETFDEAPRLDSNQRQAIVPLRALNAALPLSYGFLVKTQDTPTRRACQMGILVAC